MTGRPVLAHRDLGNSLSRHAATARHALVSSAHRRREDQQRRGARSWLDNKGDVMRRIMYDQRSQFTRATKQGDHDFVAFGQTVIAVDVNSLGNGMLYRTFHLRDVAWCENDELVIDTVHHNWKHEVRALIKKFPKTVSADGQGAGGKEPYREIKCRRIIMPADQYDLTEKAEERGAVPVRLADGRLRERHHPRREALPPRALCDPALADRAGLALRAFAGDCGGAARRAHAAANQPDAARGRAEGGRSAAEGHLRSDPGRGQCLRRRADLGRRRI
jgi:hypothetical protein